MALNPHDTHQAAYSMNGMPWRPYLPYISSIIQDMEVSGKMVKFAIGMGTWLGLTLLRASEYRIFVRFQQNLPTCKYY